MALTPEQEAKVDVAVEKATQAANTNTQIIELMKDTTGRATDIAAGIAQHNNDPNAHTGIMVLIKDQLKAHIEKVSDGALTVLRDTNGNPHIMKRIPRFRVEDIDASFGTGIHPAFFVGDKEVTEILLGKYKLSQATTGYATISGVSPKVSITFDAALAACRSITEKGGRKFSLATIAIHGAENMLLWKKFGDNHEYYGNRNFGRDSTKHEQVGVLENANYQPGDSGNGGARTLLGSGGEDWNDNGRYDGVADWVGNVWEWIAGMRTLAGKIQIIEGNDAMLPSCNMAANSAEWREVLETGTFVTPGTAGTLAYEAPKVGTGSNKNVGAAKLSNTNAIISQLTGDDFCSNAFKDLVTASGVSCPAILKQLSLFPYSSGLQGAFWIRNGERLPFRGGDWHSGAGAGPWALNLYGLRSYSYGDVGCRAAFCSYTV